MESQAASAAVLGEDLAARGDVAAARQELEAAVAGYETLRGRHEDYVAALLDPAEASLALGRVLVRGGDRASARTRLSDAIRTDEALEHAGLLSPRRRPLLAALKDELRRDGS